MDTAIVIATIIPTLVVTTDRRAFIQEQMYSCRFVLWAYKINTRYGR